MTAAWMIYVLLVGGLLAVGAGCVEESVRAVGRPTRWLWAAAMLGTIAFAGYALRGIGSAELTPLVGTKVVTAAPAVVPASHDVLAVLESWRSGVERAIALSIATASGRVPRNAVALALVLWAAATVVLLAVHVRTSGRMRRERSAWPIATLPGGTARVAPALGPAVIGLSSPEIVVPQWLLEKSDEEQRLVMVHEQEHIAARDQYLPFGALLIAALLPWHPAMWWSFARLRLAMELDCDARVLRRGEQAKSYGTLLIDIAARCGGHRVGAVALADRTSHLERRILAMTARTPRFTRARAIGLASAAGLAIITACEARLPTSSEVQSMDVASAEKSLALAKVIDDRASANAVYVVNGETVSAEQAHAIPASRIAAMNVLKGAPNAEGTRVMQVRITTSDVAGFDRRAGGLSKVVSDVPESVSEGRHMKVSSPNGYHMIPDEKRAALARNDKFEGLLIIDGVRAPEGALARLTPDQIATVNILKGEAAKAYSSDPAAANGIIKVTTKAAASKAAP